MEKRRNQHYVDYEVQYTLAKRLALHWLSLMSATGVAMVIWARLIEAPLESWSEVFRVAAGHFIPFVFVALVLIPMFLRDALKLSNRFAGPIVRVRRVLSEIAEGNVPEKVEFRNGDFWSFLAVDLNRVANKLRGVDKQS